MGIVMIATYAGSRVQRTFEQCFPGRRRDDL